MRDNRGGFTMVEVVAVLAVMAVVATLAVVSLAPWFGNYASTQRQANAESLYLSLQSGMVNLKAEGRLSTVEGEGSAVASYEDEDGSNGGCVLLSSEDADQKAVLEAISRNLDTKTSTAGFMSLGANGSYCVELNPVSGYVYGVFYSEERLEQGVYQASSLQRDDYQALAAMKVAYYGGGSLADFEAADASTDGYVGYFEFGKSGDLYKLSGMYAYRYADVDGEGGEDLAKLNATLSASGSIDKACYGVLVSEKSNPAVSSDPQSLLGTVLDDSTLEATDIRVSIANDAGVENDYVLYRYKKSALANNSSWTPIMDGGVYALNANFAAAVKTSGTFSATSTYQIRTAAQLQHIGQPLDESASTYLGASFLQTHVVTLSESWVPIGVENAETGAATSFTGSYLGAIDGSSVSNGIIDAKPAAPSSNDSAKRFPIVLKQGFKFGTVGDEQETLISVCVADKDRDAKPRVAGIFGSLKGELAYVDVRTEGDVTLISGGTKVTGVANGLDNAAVGTLVGAVFSGSDFRRCSLEVAHGTLSTGTAAIQRRYGLYGGLAGYCAAASSNLAVTVDEGATLSMNPVASDSGVYVVYSGGVVGYTRADLDSAKLAVDGTVSIRREGTGNDCHFGGITGQIDSDATVTYGRVSVGNSGKLKVVGESLNSTPYLGGLAGNSDGDIDECKVSVEGEMTVSGSSSKGGTMAYAGGVVGLLNGKVTQSSCEVSGEASVKASASSGKDCYAGGFAGLVGSGGTSGDKVGVNGELRVTAENGTGSGTALAGGFAGGISKGTGVSSLECSVSGVLKVKSENEKNGLARSGGVLAILNGENASGTNLAFKARGAEVSVTSKSNNESTTSGLIAGYLDSTAVLDAPRVSVSNGSDVLVSARWDYSMVGFGTGAAKSTRYCAAAGGVAGYVFQGTVRDPRLVVSEASSLSVGDEGRRPSFSGAIVGFHNGGTLELTEGKAVVLKCDKEGECRKEHIDLHAVNNEGVVCGGKRYTAFDYACSTHSGLSGSDTAKSTNKYLDGYADKTFQSSLLDDSLQLYPKNS